jgi:hypothetical protein
VCDKGFGVADGVSGWNDFGFSPHAFSTQLMDHAKKELENFTTLMTEMTDEKRRSKSYSNNLEEFNLENLD